MRREKKDDSQRLVYKHKAPGTHHLYALPFIPYLCFLLPLSQIFCPDQNYISPTKAVVTWLTFPVLPHPHHTPNNYTHFPASFHSGMAGLAKAPRSCMRSEEGEAGRKNAGILKRETAGLNTE